MDCAFEGKVAPSQYRTWSMWNRDAAEQQLGFLGLPTALDRVLVDIALGVWVDFSTCSPTIV
jgi:hypothetical protein